MDADGLEAPEGGPVFRNAGPAQILNCVQFRSAERDPLPGEVIVTGADLFLRDDNTGATGTAYMGAVNDDMIQNAMPIATNTILIIF